MYWRLMSVYVEDIGIDRVAFIPVYEQVAQHLRKRILEGVLAPGSKLPAEAEMALQLGVSRDTCRRSFKILEKQQLLYQAHGKGTFVSANPRVKKISRLGVVGLAADSVTGSFGADIVNGLQDVLSSLPGAAEIIFMPKSGRPLIDAIKANGLDGVVLYGADHYLDDLCRPAFDSVPHVAVCSRSDKLRKANRFFVDSDNIDGATKAVEYLIGLGHKRIAHLAGPAVLTNSQDRLIGFRQAMQNHGLPVDESLVAQFDPGPWLKMAVPVVEEWLRRSDRPTAIFAGGQSFALAVYQAVKTLGLRIPEDVSLVGFDDPEACAHLSPPMTTVRQAVRRLGEQAAEMMLAQIVPGRRTKPWVLIDTELIVRQSCAPVGALNAEY